MSDQPIKDMPEVTCAKYNAHLGYASNDDPANKGGKQSCINARSLDFNKK